jgi:hypothetical protein
MSAVEEAELLIEHYFETVDEIWNEAQLLENTIRSELPLLHVTFVLHSSCVVPRSSSFETLSFLL